MTVETRAVRRPSAAELQQAWRALTSGEYAVGKANGAYAVSGTNSVNRVVRSTNVPSAEALAWPTSKSPSQ